MSQFVAALRKQAGCFSGNYSVHLAAIVIAALGLLLPSLLLAETVSYAMLFPETDGATREVFDEARKALSKQIEARGDRLVELSLDRMADNRATVQNWLSKATPDLVLALGRTSLEALSGQESRYRIIASLVDIPVQEQPALSAVTILPEPRSIFGTMRMLAPSIRRVFVVYSPKRHAWLIERGMKQARDMGITLEPLRADTITQAAGHFTNVFRYSNPETDALWLIDSQWVTDDTTLPLIAEESWLDKFVVCSNAIQHLTKGVLCTTFVRPALAAEAMLQLAQERLAGKPARILMLSDVSRGVNARVGSHLGIPFNNDQRRQFQLIIGE